MEYGGRYSGFVVFSAELAETFGYMTLIPIPKNERSLLLKPVLKECFDSRNILLTNQYRLGILPIDIFANAMGQWFLSEDLPESQHAEVEVRKRQLHEVGFDGDAIKSRIQDLFESDLHLSKCCKSPWKLTKCLSTLFFNYLGENLSNDQLDLAIQRFEDYLYQEKYSVYSIHHLYNFDADLDWFEIDGTTLRRFSENEIAAALEHEALFNLFHSKDVGTFFAFREVWGDDTNEEKFFEVLSRTNNSINDVIGTLQLVKDGFVCVDYMFLNYKPDWVNKLFHPLPVGVHQRLPYDEGKNFCHFSKTDIYRANEWLRLWRSDVAQSKLEQSSKLGKIIRLAIEFYSSSFSQQDEAQRLLHLTFALEALYSPDDQKELSFRIRQYASQFIGMTAEERKQIFDTVKNAYNQRSKLVHGSLDVSAFIDDTLTTASENRDLASVVRRSVLRMLVLLFRGRTNLKAHDKPGCIHGDLELAALNQSSASRIRKESDFEEFLRTYES